MIRSIARFSQEFIGNEGHAWLLLMLGALYGTLVTILSVVQFRTGTVPDTAILKSVADTLVWWGGIVATGATAKKVATTMKGGTPVPAQDPGA